MTLQIILILGVGGAIVFGLPRLYTELFASNRLYSPSTSPSAPVAIVFGAGLRKDGSPTLILQDRVAAAVQLYFDGKVKKLLMSGDNRFVDYNEPGAMSEYAISLGVPAEDIVLDYAGRRTYDTCYRARDIFGVSEAVLVTQKFHQPRAIFTCNALGIKSVGAIADQRPYRSYAHNFWRLRELLATLRALWDVWIERPLPVLGAPEPIFLPTEKLHTGGDEAS